MSSSGYTTENIVNIVVDCCSIIAIVALFALTTVLYFGQRCYRLIHALLCFKTYELSVRFDPSDDSNTSREDWRRTLHKRAWMYILVHSMLLFLLFRFVAEWVTLMQHVYTGIDMEASLMIQQVRRMTDYIGLMWYFTIFTNIIPIWMQVALVWLDRDDKWRRIIKIVIFTVMITVTVITMIALAPLVVFALLEMIIGNTERIRKILLFAVAAPCGVVSLAIVCLFVIIMGIKIVHIIRQSRFNQAEQKSMREQVSKHKRTVQKMSIAMIFFTLCILIRVLGIALYSINGAPDYVIYPLVKMIPDAVFVIMICLVFWPWPLPLLPEPLELVSSLQHVAAEMQARATAQGKKSTNATQVDLEKVSE